MLNQNSEYYFLQGGGEMGKLIRAKDWSKTSLGDPEDWPQSLRTMVAFMLDNPIGMYIAWGNDYIQLYNDNYRAILDDTKHPRALGISTNETFPEVWNIVGPMFNDVMKGKPIGFPDFMLPIYRNGNVEECYFNFSYTPIRKDDGEVGGILATVIETTNKKKSEKALIESAQRFKILVRDATAAIVVLTGPEMKVEIVNEAYGRLINLKPVDLIDKPLFSVIPEAKEYYLPLLENVRKKGEMLQLYDSPYAVTVNGKLIEGFLHVVYQPYRDTDGNIIGVMAILQDVTEGVLARKKIEQSEKKFEAAIQAVEGITWTNNCKGEMIGEQLGWAQLTGQRYEEYQGYGWAKAVHPDDAQPTIDAWNKAVANKSTFVFEHRVKTKRDGLRHFSIKAVPVFDEDATLYQWVGVHTDITEQKEAAQKIKESEERFRIMADAAPNVIWALNPDGSQKYINKYAINFLGVSLQEAVSLNWQPFIHPDDLESTGKAVADAVQNKTMYTKEHRLLRHDGEYRWFLSQGAPSFFENGELYGFVGSGIDITERKETEKSLAYRTALLEAHNEASVDGILLVDAKGKIFSFNQRFIEIWNMPQHIVDANDDEAALAFSMTQLVNPKQFIDKVKYLYEHPTETSLDELEFKDGRIIERNGYPVVSEESIYYAWSWTFKDITSQKKYEKTIIDSERRFRLLADSMPQHIWTSDPEGNLNYYNQSVLDYSGLTLEQIYNEGWIKIVHPDDRDENIKEWTNSITTGKDFLFEHRFHRHDGEYRWQLSRAIPQKDENGKIQMWVGTSTDIQDQKTFTNELEKQVHNRTKELADTNIELERKNKELESFAYISSHDLQEPLRKIQTFATRILDKEYQVLSDIGKDYFKRMQDAANRMQTLIQDLLVYSRATTAERKLEITNLHKIIMEVKEDLSEVLNDKHATIETTELCEVNVIPFQFRQLMNNLIGNSLKFSNPNIAPHIKIKSEIANGINFNNPKLLHQKKYCHISVSDNGIGFDPQYSQRIFEVFQRLHGKNAYNGTGIGLSIVKKIVENHEGIITANGELDKGATFDIYIPI